MDHLVSGMPDTEGSLDQDPVGVLFPVEGEDSIDSRFTDPPAGVAERTGEPRQRTAPMEVPRSARLLNVT